MASEQMGMPAAAPSPEEMAVFDQMRQNISPKEFSDEMLAGAEQVDPQAVSEFRQELDGLDMPPEVLDALNDLVDEILANPERYDEIRQQYIAQGIPEDFLPAQFDPQFFAALNMAIDQMVGAPAGPQAFAKGGIAELKPIARAIASYGRNGDTMLAHITPAEARMLKRRGGSGTINPKTGLPEFFLGKVFKSVGKALKKVGNAVKKFASSTVGRLVTTVALGFFLGPAAASMLGATSAAGVAAVSGFVGSAGSTLLAGGNLRDALKAGAVGGLTAGAGAGIMGGAEAFQAGSYTGPTTVGGQFERLKSAFSPTPLQQAVPPAAQAPVPAGTEGAAPLGVQTTGQAPVPQTAAPVDATAVEGPLAKPSAVPSAGDAYRTPTVGESFSKIGEGLGMGEAPASFETLSQGVGDLFSPGPTNAQVVARAQEIMRATPGATLKDAMAAAAKEMSPGILRTYGPAAVAGIGTLAATGGFESKPAQLTPEAQMMRDRLQREEQMLRENPGMFTPKGFERFGAQYNEKGQISGWNPWSAASAGAFQQYYNPLRFTQFAPPQIEPTSPPPGYAKGGIATLAAGGPVADSAEYNKMVKDWFDRYPTATAAEVSNAIQTYGLNPQDVANAMRASGMSNAAVYSAFHPDVGVPETPQGGLAGLTSNINQFVEQARGRQDLSPAQIRAEAYRAMLNEGYSMDDVRRATGMTVDELFPDVRKPVMPPSRVSETPFTIDQSPMPAPTVIPQPPAPKVPTQPAPIPWNLMPDFQRYVQATYGTPIRPTWSVLGNQVEGTQDPFGAPKRTPIYSQLAPFQLRSPGSSTLTGDSSINLPIYSGPSLQSLADAWAPIRQSLLSPYAAVSGGTTTGGGTTTDQNGKVIERAAGGIAALKSGGYPRRTGQIDGPGTETSDSIPAMLSDGEFVMTAKAVRGAGNGSRREGAKKMYALMHRLEKNAARG